MEPELRKVLTIRETDILVSKNGDIFKFTKYGLSKKRLNVWSKPNGYTYYYYIKLGGKKYFIHRLVYKAFVDETLPYFWNGSDRVINHKDGNGFNNSLDNLEEVTQSENLRHAIEELPESRKVDKIISDENNGIIVLKLNRRKAKVISRKRNKL